MIPVVLGFIVGCVIGSPFLIAVFQRHQWSEWSEPVECGIVRVIIAQRRVCTNCGKVKVRVIVK